MTAPRDYYEILGVTRGAAADEIKKSYRNLARTLHPDVNKEEDAAEKFARLQEAYDVLSDPERRRHYDQFGHAGATAGRPGAGPHVWSGTGGYGAEGPDLGSIFEDLFGGGRGQPTGRWRESDPSRHGRAAVSRGGDISDTLHITFLTAVNGGREKVRLVSDGQPQTIDVTVPGGIDHDDKLRVRGKGRPGSAGGDPGDLILTVRVGGHPYFRREKLDLFIDVPITIVEAALGTTLSVPLLRGSVELTVPAGTASGQKLRVKGKGIQDSKGGTGDFFAVIQIIPPESLSDDDRQLLDALGERLKNPRESTPWSDSLQ